MTTIDDARKELDEACRMLSVGAAVGAMPIHYADAVRTLLAHTADYDALKGRLEEAVRLMGPFASAYNNRGHASLQMDVREPQFRALAAFLDREKEAGRG